MSKELPWFKFDCDEWITGDITACDMDCQGLLINVCAYYWKKKCSMSLAIAKQRFGKYEKQLEKLLSRKIIKLDQNNNIIINFLDEQINSFENISKKRANAGRKGGKAKAKQLLEFAKAKRSNIEIEIEKEIDKDKNKIITPFEKVFDDFREMRKKIKKPLTPNAEKLIINKLNKMEPDNIPNQIKILENSVMNSWQGVFPLNENDGQQKYGILKTKKPVYGYTE